MERTEYWLGLVFVANAAHGRRYICRCARASRSGTADRPVLALPPGIRPDVFDGELARTLALLSRFHIERPCLGTDTRPEPRSQ
jgi:hypothetical protein